MRHSLKSTDDSCGLIGPPAFLVDGTSVLWLLLYNVKSPPHSPALAMLSRRETDWMRTYSHWTRNTANPHFIIQFFISLNLICLKNMFAYIEPLLYGTNIYFPYVLDIVGSDCNTILWPCKIVWAKLQRKMLVHILWSKWLFVCLSKIIKVNWLDHFNKIMLMYHLSFWDINLIHSWS